MRWLLGFVLLLLALGTLRVVGCGDEGVEPCESASDCDDQDRCTVDQCVRGECSYEPADCVGDAECTFDVCDPDWGCYEPDGTDCCAKRDCCYPCGDFCFFCQICCVERGGCIDGFCRGWDWWVCGDGVSHPIYEECDGMDLQGFNCTDFRFTGGTLACTVDCTFDISSCTPQPVCGNDTLEFGEFCDGTDVDGWTCADLGFTGGTPACNATCDNFDLTDCTGGPPGWTCPVLYYAGGAADGCDCGCGVIDPDCADDTVASCESCDALGSCSNSACPGDIDPAQNWLCDG